MIFPSEYNSVADLVQWSPDGKSYMIAVNNKLDIYSVEVTVLKLCYVELKCRSVTIEYS